MTRRWPRRLGVGILTLAAAAAGFAGLGEVAGLRTLATEVRATAVSAAASSAGAGFARWLTASARAARADGVAPMPVEIRQALAGFMDAAELDTVRYRNGGGAPWSLQGSAFLHPHTRAVALEDLIVFRDQATAAKPRYWVHELVHLQQVRRWGLAGFAERYVRDPAAVEAEAWAVTERYVAWALRRDLDALAGGEPQPRHRPAEVHGDGGKIRS